MDAVSYQMSFDKEQLALLCANYDRRIDSLGAENKRLKAENAKLRELVSGLEYCVQGYVCDSCPLYDPLGTNHRRCESLERELRIEVDDA